MARETLKKIGLNDSEIDIYLDIIKHGESLASEIAARIKISRTYVYDAIQNLLDKGLIVYVIRSNRKCFKALEMEKLLEYLDEKRIEIEKQKQEVMTLIKELKVFQRPIKEKPVVEVFEGNEGLKTILNDIIKQGKDIIAWGATDRIKDHLPDWILKKYVDEKAKKGMKTEELYVKGEKTLMGEGYINKEVPKEFSNPATFSAYGDRVVIFFWSDTPVVIRIINQKITDSFKKHFEFLWKKVE